MKKTMQSRNAWFMPGVLCEMANSNNSLTLIGFAEATYCAFS